MSQYNVTAVPSNNNGFELHITGPNDFEELAHANNNGEILDTAKNRISTTTGEPADKIGILLRYNMHPEQEQQ